MKLIMENWRQSFKLDSLLKEGNINKYNLKKIADVQAANADNEQIQQKITNALLSDPKVKEMVRILSKAFKKMSSAKPNPTVNQELESAGLNEGVGDFFANLGAAIVHGRAGDMESALRTVGMGKIADADPKILGAAIMVLGGAGMLSGIDPLDAAKVASVGAKVSVGGINAVSVEDLENVAAATAGVEGGRNAE